MLNANLYHALAVHRGHCLVEYPPQLLEIQSPESSFDTGRHLVHEMSRQRPIYLEMLGRDTKMFQEIKNYRTPSLQLRVEFQSFSGFKPQLWGLRVVVVVLLSHVWLFATPWTVAYQAPLSMGCPRWEHWSGLPFPSPGNLPNPGIKPESSELAGAFFTTEPPGKPWVKNNWTKNRLDELKAGHIWETLCVCVCVCVCVCAHAHVCVGIYLHMAQANTSTQLKILGRQWLESEKRGRPWGKSMKRAMEGLKAATVQREASGL